MHGGFSRPFLYWCMDILVSAPDAQHYSCRAISQIAGIVIMVGRWG
jgi:hypothetical protein